MTQPDKAALADEIAQWLFETTAMEERDCKALTIKLLRRFPALRADSGMREALEALGYPWLPCPICKGVEGCDHSVPERARAALAQSAPQAQLPMVDMEPLRAARKASDAKLYGDRFKSAPAFVASHNSGEGDPSVMPDYVITDDCILCANSNDLPEGEYCRACGRKGLAMGLRAAVIKARGRQEPPTTPIKFAAPDAGRLATIEEEMAQLRYEAGMYKSALLQNLLAISIITAMLISMWDACNGFAISDNIKEKLKCTI